MFDLMEQLSLSITMSAISECNRRNWNIRCGVDNNDTRVYRILAGSGAYSCNGKSGIFRPGYYYLLPARCEVEFHTDDRIRLAWAHLDLWWRREIHFFNLVTPKAAEVPPLGDDFARRFDRTGAAFNASPPERLAALGTMYELFGHFWRVADFTVPAGQDRRLRRLSRALRLIDAQPQRGIGVAELAAAAGMGESQFFAEFKELLGTSPARYALLRRLDRVRRLLRDSDRKLASLAEETGFGDAFHLSKVFKREYGVSPRDYRKAPPTPQP